MAMYCPRCNLPMASGTLIGPRGLLWEPDVLPPGDDTDGRVRLHDNKLLDRFLSGDKLAAYYCEDCNLLLTQPNMKKRK